MKEGRSAQDTSRRRGRRAMAGSDELEAEKHDTTAPLCPGCHQRDTRIAELERKVAELERGGTDTRDAGPNAADGSDEEAGQRAARRRVRVRLRLSPDEANRRRRRKELRRVLVRYAIAAGAFAFGVLAIYVILWFVGSLAQP